MSLDNRQNVIKVMSNTGGKLTDRLKLLCVAQLRFQIETLGYVGPVAMDHLTGNDRKERPGKRPIIDCEFLAEFAVAEPEAFAGDRCGIFGQDRFGIFEAKRAAHLASCRIQVSKGAIGSQLHHRIGIEANERSQLLDLRFGPFAICDVANGAGSAKLIAVKVRLGVNFNPAKRAVASQIAGFIAAVALTALDQLRE